MHIRKEQDFLITYSKEEIAEELVRISKITGNKFVNRHDIEEHGKIHYGTIKRKFGGLINALIFAKLISEADKKKKYGRVTKEELFKEIGRIWELTLSKYKRRPFIKDFKENSILPPWAWDSHFGSFRKALAAYLAWEEENINKQEIGVHYSPNKVATNDKQRNKFPFTRRTIPPGLRWRVFSRDDLKCTVCGKDPKHYEITLEVDHIIPWSEGGPTEIDNLRTLCSKCNLGKSNK